MARTKDFLDEIVGERTRRDPDFPNRVAAALDRRALMRSLAEDRVRAGISQTLVAAAMRTSQSAVARIETGEADVRLSTLDRYATAIGRTITWSVRPRAQVRRKKAAAAKRKTARRRAARARG